MREQEMRMRVFRFLKARMRNMIMPATVGIGLAVGGCAQEGTALNHLPEDSGSPARADVLQSSDTQPISSDSAAPGQDSPPPRTDLASDAREAQLAADLASDTHPDLGGRDLPADGVPSKDLSAPDGSPADVPAKPDQAVVLDGGGLDGGTDLGVITKYGVPMPDSGADKPAPLYTAVMPDAGAGADGLAVRYMAVMPDTAPDRASPVPDYMAPFQS